MAAIRPNNSSLLAAGRGSLLNVWTYCSTKLVSDSNCPVSPLLRVVLVYPDWNQPPLIRWGCKRWSSRGWRRPLAGCMSALLVGGRAQKWQWRVRIWFYSIYCTAFHNSRNLLWLARIRKSFKINRYKTVNIIIQSSHEKVNFVASEASDDLRLVQMEVSDSWGNILRRPRGIKPQIYI